MYTLNPTQNCSSSSSSNSILASSTEQTCLGRRLLPARSRPLIALRARWPKHNICPKCLASPHPASRRQGRPSTEESRVIPGFAPPHQGDPTTASGILRFHGAKAASRLVAKCCPPSPGAAPPQVSCAPSNDPCSQDSLIRLAQSNGEAELHSFSEGLCYSDVPSSSSGYGMTLEIYSTSSSSAQTIDPQAWEEHSLESTGINASVAISRHQKGSTPDRPDKDDYETAPQPPHTVSLPDAQTDPKASSQQPASSAEVPVAESKAMQWAKIWALVVLSASYIHQASTGFAIPVMLPMISKSLSLDDFQGAMLTTGYSYLYALALVPVGLLADKTARPKLLGAGLAVWSALTAGASTVGSFQELMLARVAFAAAQSTQNVICFSMIPELFPNNRSTALAIYNCAVYLGRGAMYFASSVAKRLLHSGTAGATAGAAAAGAVASNVVSNLDASGYLMVPLDKLDLRLVQIVYTTGDMAVVAPIYGFLQEVNTLGQGLEAVAGGDDFLWREVLKWLAIPGFVVALAMLTVPEPRDQAKKQQQQGNSSGSSGGSDGAMVLSSFASSSALSLPAAASATMVEVSSSSTSTSSSSVGAVLKLASNKAFLATTLSASFNDLASYALVAWQSTFYERVYHLSASDYAPVLATVLPIGGIIGGVGGGWVADKLAKMGHRVWITAGASILAAPFIWDSVTAKTSEESFFTLMIGFALAEAWRAPSAVMARSVAPADMGSTASALYLCIRNLVGGLGPVMIARLSTTWGLQNALQLVPVFYLLSGLGFIAAEALLAKDPSQQEASQPAAEQQQTVVLDGGKHSTASSKLS